MRADAGAVAGAATVPAVGALRPVLVLRAAVALMLVGNLGRIPLVSTSTKDAPLLFNELVLLAALGATFLACARVRSLRLDSVALAALAFAGVGATSAILAAGRFRLSGFELLFSLAYLGRWLAYFGIYLAVLNVTRPADAPALWRTYERTVIAFAAFGVVQSIFLPGFAQLVYPEETATLYWDRQGHRLVSTLLDPNFAGAFVLPPLLVLLARMSYGERVAPLVPTLLLAALLMTVSRSSTLALVVGGSVIVAARGLSRRLLRYGAGVLLLMVPLLPALVRFALSFDKFSIDASALARVVSWTRALRVLGDNPLLGIGFNTYGFVQRFYGYTGGRESFALDGGLLFIAVMTGAVGVAIYAAMLVLVWRRCRALWRSERATPWARGTALGVAATTAALTVHSVFVNSLLLPFLMESLWLLWGLVFLLAREHATVPTAQPAAEARPTPRLVALGAGTG